MHNESDVFTLVTPYRQSLLDLIMAFSSTMFIPQTFSFAIFEKLSKDQCNFATVYLQRKFKGNLVNTTFKNFQ